MRANAIKREFTQSLFDKAEYKKETKNGSKIVYKVATRLTQYFVSKTAAAEVSY